jgi:hypothetical protein
VASVAAPAKAGIRRVSPQTRQLGYARIIGSATLGTVALLVLRAKPVSPVRPLSPSGSSVIPGRPVSAPFPPFILMPGWAQLSILTLLAALFVALLMLGWRTSGVTWLPAEARGRLLWALIVGVAGLAAWFFAATVTFGAGFGQNLQIVLGYAGGGLPFALIASMLLRSWRVNLWAAGISALLVAVGFILVAYRSPGQPSALRLYFQYLSLVFGGGGQVVLY